MKKLMIVASVIAIAAIANAASVTWGGAAGNPNWQPAAEGQYAYLLYGSSSAALATSITVDTLGDFGSDIVGKTADNGYTVVAYHQITASEDNDGYFTAGWSRDDSAGGVNGYYQIILADVDDEKFAVRAADAAVTGITDTTPGGGKAIYNMDWDLGDSTWVGSNGFTGDFVTTPEPTSGLLLLIGMAGLALKRKRA